MSCPVYTEESFCYFSKATNFMIQNLFELFLYNYELSSWIVMNSERQIDLILIAIFANCYE